MYVMTSYDCVMGIVMHIRSGASAEIDDLIGDDSAVFEWATEEAAWEADQMWWAVLDLLFGPGGVSRLQGEPITEGEGYTPVMRIESSAVAELASGLSQVDEATVADRFAEWRFGDPLGPEPMQDDRDWLVAAAIQLAQLLRKASETTEDLVWVVA
jgi:hypothetical protein